ncbi:MAG: VRR-NUC domain-containing protein [Lachnospiraceae bacterium]|nr:VRR-NUC domain-containing protein [Lachnospiraceae bacterium]
MREKETERKLVRAVKRVGGICPKFVSPGMDGMPDRMILLPGGKIGFVEAKAPGRKPRILQVRRHRQLRNLGFPVFILDDPEQIPSILGEVEKWSTQ